MKNSFANSSIANATASTKLLPILAVFSLQERESLHLESSYVFILADFFSKEQRTASENHARYLENVENRPKLLLAHVYNTSCMYARSEKSDGNP